MDWFFSSFFTWLWPPNPRSPYPESRARIHYSEKTTVETTLEQSRDLNTLQRFRYRVHKDTKYAHRIPIRQLLDTEQDLRHYTQKELFAREHDDGSEEMKTWLNYVNKTIWQLTREWWNHRSEFGEGVVSRAFDLWRSHPAWYMHEVLVEDCGAGLGGVDAVRSASYLEAGNCALTCGCCRTARGFELTKEEENEIYAALDFPADNNFYDRIELASIWGLRLDSYESPFDLIKSGYEQVNDGNGKLCSTDYTENLDDSSTTEEF
ncbi:hypothetical protein N7501_003938 [Penicillium viridicatum]|nr:hypothetical protein N7501_003938 [Penicillium viridicatum]